MADASPNGYPQTVIPGEAGTTPPAQEYSEVKISLENCIIPQNRLLNTPSSEDGIDAFLEFSLRRYGCDLIQLAGHLLKLPQVAMATAQVLYQRFFYSRSFLKHHYQRVAMACVMLSSKVEEAPRRPREVINTFHHVKQVCFFHETPTPVVLDAEYLRIKTDVIKCERRLLKELGFCVHVQHPHKLISVYAKILLADTPLKIRDHDVNPFLQNAWNYMNDSLRTDLFVRYPPEHIACACISLALRDQTEVALPQNPYHWAQTFGIERDELELMCREIRALYEIKPPSMKEVDDSIERARTTYEKKRQEQIVSSALATAQAKAIELTNKHSPTIIVHSNAMPATKAVIIPPASVTVAAAMSTTITSGSSVTHAASTTNSKSRPADKKVLNDRDRHGNVRQVHANNDAERSRDKNELYSRKVKRAARSRSRDADVDERRRERHHRQRRAERDDDYDDRDESKDDHRSRSGHRHSKHKRRHKSHRHRNDSDKHDRNDENGIGESRKPTESAEDRQRRLAALAAKVIGATRMRDLRRSDENEQVSS